MVYYIEMKLTKEQMYLARIEPEEMGFCAHKLLQYRMCVRANQPWYTNCLHEKHEFAHCKTEE